MAARVRGRDIECSGEERDRYGRLLATCRIGKADLGRALVRDGVAMAYRRYSTAYVPDEGRARQERRGLWAGSVERPEDFRQAEDAVVAAADPAVPAGCVIKGNISGSGQIYHVPGQHDYAATRINPSKGERWFCSAGEAEAAGWRAARR